MPKIKQEKLVRSRFKDNIFYIWRTDISKKELCAVIPLEVIQELLKHHGNSNWVLYDICKKGMTKAVLDWIENTKDESLKQRRKEAWSNHPFVSDLVVDDMVREIRKQATKNNIDLRSWFENRS